jgi:hypothetical protein
MGLCSDPALEAGQDGTFFPSLLSPSLPDVTYHVYSENFVRHPYRIYYHVKDSTKEHTLYTLASDRQNKMQIPVCIMARAAEYHSVCVRVVVTPIVHPPTRLLGTFVGRPLTLTTETGTTIISAPDRQERPLWTPRRFIYGRREFVWKKDDTQRGNWEVLFEVKRRWTESEGKAGKTFDETFDRPLVWCQGALSTRKVCTIHMVGGLDMLFRELLLADLLSRRLVAIHGVVL